MREIEKKERKNEMNLKLIRASKFIETKEKENIEKHPQQQ